MRSDNEVTGLQASVKEGASLAQAAKAIKALLRERYNLGENEDVNFNVIDAKHIAEKLSRTIRVMTMLLGAVAVISLIVGGIGIINR